MFLAIACPLLISGCNKGQEPAENRPWQRTAGKTLLMHYMPWYETPDRRGQWGVHWTGHERQHQPGKVGPDGMPDIWSHYHPLIGLYDSTDPDVLECQLLQMRIAGIDGVIVDWYGIGPSADYPPIHEATRAMFDAAGRNEMKFAVCYEDRSIAYMEKLNVLDPEKTGEYLSETMRWMQENWFREPQYFRTGGRPLLLNFGPMHVRDASTWSDALGSIPDRPAYYGLHHLWKSAGADGGFMWVNQSAWDGDPNEETIRQRLQAEFDHAAADPAKLIVAAYPGFKDVYDDSHAVLDHRNGKTMAESLRICRDSPSEIIQLVTWNDYGEGTMIEPTHEFGYTFLEVIQAERRKELGNSFPYVPADLTLPALLLDHRRKHPDEKATGDRAVEMILAGDCGAARVILQSEPETEKPKP